MKKIKINPRKILTYYVIILMLFSSMLVVLVPETSAVAPTITTNDATGMTENNATLNGYLTNDGGKECTVGFQYGLTSLYGTTWTTNSIYGYLAGYGSGAHEIYQFWKSNMTVRAIAYYGSTITALVQDNNYVYAVGGYAPGTISQYWASNMTLKATSSSYGGTIHAILIDSTYVYIGGATTNKIYQYWISNLTKKAESASYTNIIETMTQDATYLWIGGETDKVYQYRKSDLVKVAESANYGGTITALTQDATYVYAGGYTLRKTNQYWKSNMTLKRQTASYGGDILSIIQDTNYLYVGGGFGYVSQYWKSNMTFMRQSVAYGGTILALSQDSNYIYVGGEVTKRVDQFWKSNLTYRAQSTIYTGSIDAVSTTNFSTGYTFSYNLQGLLPGRLYYFRAIANNSDGSSVGLGKTFRTLPTAPSSFLASTYNRTQINVTWVKATGANKTTVQEKLGSYPASVTDGTNIYNGTGTSYHNTGLLDGTSYYYRAWSWNSTLSLYSTSYASSYNTTINNYIPRIANGTVFPTSGTISVTTFRFNVSILDTDDAHLHQVRTRIEMGSSVWNNSMTWLSGSNLTGAKYTYLSGTFTVSGTYVYKFLVYDGFDWNISGVAYFTVITDWVDVCFPSYLEVGDYIMGYGSLRLSNGSVVPHALSQTWILDSSTWLTVPFSHAYFYVSNGFYMYWFSSSGMIPGIYYIRLNYTYGGTLYSYNWILYLSIPGGSGHIITDIHFSFYNYNTGEGIDSSLFKLYAGTTIPPPRLYGDTYYHAYTGETIYFLVTDFYGNQIYPTIGIYSLFVTQPNQVTDIPVIWNDLAIKNMNNTIMHFSMHSGSRTYSITLFPMDSVHLNVLPGNYTVTMTFYSSYSGAYAGTRTDNITVSGDGFYIATGYTAAVYFTYYNTNEGLGLPTETLKLYIDGNRAINMLYYTYINKTINITVKDYYDQIMYTGNYTVQNQFTFLDFGLTFHSWKFCNMNNQFYMISLLKQNATRWWERAVCPYETIEFLIPSGNYRLRIYNATHVEIFNNTFLIVNSRAYVINGSTLYIVINGTSVIIGQLLSLSTEVNDAFDYLTMPFYKTISRNPPIVFSAFDSIGNYLGQNVYKICPPINVIAQTRYEKTGTRLNSTPLIPVNGTLANGSITVIDDVIYFDAVGGVVPSWVRITYLNNTLIQNTTYLPSRFYPLGFSVKINASSSIHMTRETTFNQLKQFYWDYYPNTDNPGWITEPDGSKRVGYHRAGLEINNNMNTTWYEVYLYAGLSPDSQPDLSTVRITDIDNGNTLLKEGENFKATGSGIEFKLTGSMGALSKRSFLAEYYSAYSDQYYYGSEVVHINNYQINVLYNNNLYNYFKYTWINSHSQTYRGSLSFFFDFAIPTNIKQDDVVVYDVGNQRNITDFIISDQFLQIGSNAVGDVSPGGGRTYEVYFKFEKYPGQNPNAWHLATTIVTFGSVSISLFLVFIAIGVFLTFYGIVLILQNRKSKKEKSHGSTIALIGLALAVIVWILSAMGV